jgi:hypothetical protein
MRICEETGEIERDKYTHLKNVTVVLMMTVRILSRPTTNG